MLKSIKKKVIQPECTECTNTNPGAIIQTDKNGKCAKCGKQIKPKRKARSKKHHLILAGNRNLCGECLQMVYQHYHGMYVMCQNPDCTEYLKHYDMPVIQVKLKVD